VSHDYPGPAGLLHVEGTSNPPPPPRPAAAVAACQIPWYLVLLPLVAGFVSALLDNVTTVLLMGPITISMMQTCNIDPRPLLMAQVGAQGEGRVVRDGVEPGQSGRGAEGQWSGGPGAVMVQSLWPPPAALGPCLPAIAVCVTTPTYAVTHSHHTVAPVGLCNCCLQVLMSNIGGAATMVGGGWAGSWVACVGGACLFVAASLMGQGRGFKKRQGGGACACLWAWAHQRTPVCC
jgi:hypothetical protein